MVNTTEKPTHRNFPFLAGGASLNLREASQEECWWEGRLLLVATTAPPGWPWLVVMLALRKKLSLGTAWPLQIVTRTTAT